MMSGGSALALYVTVEGLFWMLYSRQSIYIHCYAHPVRLLYENKKVINSIAENPCG